MYHSRRNLSLAAAAVGLCGVWFVGCSTGPNASNQSAPIQALRLTPISAEQYAATMGEESPKAAYLRTQAAARSESVEEALRADAELGATSNPFRRADPLAVANGAVVYAAHCALCHGADARGSGPGMPNGSAKMNFHDSSKRSLLRMTGRAPKSWITSVREGTSTKPKQPGGKPLVMPSFTPNLTNEQMWLAVTYLEHVVLVDSTEKAAGAGK